MIATKHLVTRCSIKPIDGPPHHYALSFYSDQRHQATDQIGRWAENPEIPLTWRDAGVWLKRLDEELRAGRIGRELVTPTK